VTLVVRPEPDPEERLAIEAALRRLGANEGGASGPGEWWHAGIQESVDEEAERDAL
jgi:hypothetical protein